MTEGDPATVVRALIDAREAGDLDRAASYVADVALDQGEPRTRAEWRERWELMRAGVPDMAVRVEHTVTQGNWVASRYTVTGTHTGTFFGQPPTGQSFSVNGLDMVQVVDGRVVEHWVVAEPFS